ncbi:QWRF motif-containing protein 2 [Phoenix dactylifera]|uniref:QWRF motif-containing protein 2 n=1 Tax=Phoenix dactylifera TaxID=42345 RepID=A0A8B9B195_PHODC|nr:QWRF motif-containing protein 2 [Phoenix dactylifera]XP_038989969.1 QWRF motif-containing protein 2 [Phoenix dactylifera]
MVAAIRAAAASPTTTAAHIPKSPSHPDDPHNPVRPPLNPSEKDNAARRPRTKGISSRYLSSHCSSSSSSSFTTTSTSYSSSNSYSSSSSSSSSRRFPSPLLASRPSTPPALVSGPAQKRSQSVDRSRPSTPRPASAEPSAAARALCTTTRSLSVSFQGESFFYQTSRAKATSPSPARKPTPERRRASPAAATPARAGNQSENSRTFENHHRWPAARTRQSNPLMRSLDCNLERKGSILATVHLLQQSMVFDDGTRRASFDGGDFSASSDTDSVSSGSNSGAQELSVPPRAQVTPRGISVPARFWQETNSRLRRLPEPGVPLSSSGSRTGRSLPKPGLVKKSLVDSPLSSPRSVSSPLRGPMRPSSPSKIAASPSRGMASPLQARNNASVRSSPIGQPGNAPSIISFAAEVRRAKKGENRIEEAHMLRLFHNQHLQWRWVNARANGALLVQRLTAEKNLYNAWTTTTELRDSVTIKRIKLQLLKQNLKLTSILKGQMTYLEEWSLLDRDHSNALLGAIEALKASTLRLPIVGGAKADIQEVKDAVDSAVDMMQAMGSSICSLLSKVEGMSSLVSELAKMAAQEQALLDQSRDFLSMVAATHVRQCSLQGHILQLKRKPN